MHDIERRNLPLNWNAKWLNSPVSATVFAEEQAGKWNWYHSAAPGSLEAWGRQNSLLINCNDL